MTDEQRWARVKEVFGEAIDRPREERAAFLDAACDDPKVRAEVEAMLAAHLDAEGFLETPASAGFEGLPDLTGRRLGPYRIEAELGRGGMGVVYRAVRDDGTFERRVAIKVVAHGGDEVCRRLEQERRILGQLQHPSIAAIIDGGRTPEGAPYLVMQLVEGEPIDVYCRTRRLRTRERVALFRTVCAAVSYAHQNLVVHRDLKPGNILVTAAGEPMLLDFGIAKVLAGGGHPTDAPTATLLPALTPGYASPEQVKNEPITTASDVYSLGVILYELLTGRPPYRPESSSLPDLIKAVCDTAPMAPSAAAGEDGPATRAELAGDLDTIVMKALRKEPERRYGSVVELGEDLRRHLDGRPVQARGDGVGYRLGKFAWRHRLELAAAGAVLVAMVAGVVATARQARIAQRERAAAERRFNDVRRLATSFLFDFHEAIENLPGSTRARELVVKRALEYLDSLASEASGDIDLQEELATAYATLGDIQAGPNASLGDVAGARESYRRAVAIREAVVAARPDDAEAAFGLALGLSALSDRVEDADEALHLAERSLDIQKAMAARAPDDLRAQATLAKGHLHIGLIVRDRSDYARARAELERAAHLYERIAAARPGDPEAQRNLALGLKYLGGIYERMLEFASARPLFVRAVRLDEARVEADPTNATARLDLSYSYGALAYNLRSAGDLASALDYYRRALSLREATAGADPANMVARAAVARAQSTIADVLTEMNDLTGAVDANRKALALLEGLQKKNSRALMARVLVQLGNLERALADAKTPASNRLEHLRAARAWYTRALERVKALRAEGPLDDSFGVEQTAKLSDKLAECERDLAKSP